MTAYAFLTIVCDGCFSNLRRLPCKPKLRSPSHLAGWIVKNHHLPVANHGYIVLTDSSPVLTDSSPVSLYPISSTEIHCFVAIAGTELPSTSNGELSHYLRTVVAPQIPHELYSVFTSEIDKRSIRTMPSYSMPALPYPTPGALLLGDALNMRLPHGAGGMTVALSDVVIPRDLLSRWHNLNDASSLCTYLQAFYSLRKPMAVTINTLASVVDKIFCTPPTQATKEVREVCFVFFNLKLPFLSTVEPAMALLSGLNPSTMSLVLHILLFAIYGAASVLLPFPSFRRLWIGVILIWRPLDNRMAQDVSALSRPLTMEMCWLLIL
ncbi:squalene monooxygenase-like [Quillaja saponaria]|uniref:Squalene monooxygenase n=1 Tax=Quillaja saponaria TaxID=32244 RepID=A0AAD7KW06_QUISA|nr:squalene monooxygenase-like [Quillaja saponaria]